MGRRKCDAWRWQGPVLAALCLSLALAACGGDDGAVAPAEEKARAELAPEAVALTRILVESFRTAFFASLVADTTSIAGAAGAVEIRGNTWEMKGYSPDGQLVIDGTLQVGRELFPKVPVAGALSLSGSQEGTIELDMVIAVQGDELSATGTIAIDGVAFDVAELVEAAEAGAAEDGGG